MTTIAELEDYTKGAVLSADGRYRYFLERRWKGGNGKNLGWVMLNPSTADAEFDDATIRRCIGFAHDWGYSGICVGNLMAYRATNPKDLPGDRAEAIGPKRDYYLLRLDNFFCEQVIVAWGSNRPKWFDATEMYKLTSCFDMLGTSSVHVKCLGVTARGEPKHPLYLPSDTKPEPYRFPG